MTEDERLFGYYRTKALKLWRNKTVRTKEGGESSDLRRCLRVPVANRAARKHSQQFFQWGTLQTT